MCALRCTERDPVWDYVSGGVAFFVFSLDALRLAVHAFRRAHTEHDSRISTFDIR